MIQPHSFPKIFTLGQDIISHIFDDQVEITEKIDGSQFSFGKLEGTLRMRSKGAEVYPNSPDKLFQPAIKYVMSIEHLLPDNTYFYGETLAKPKHSTLAYYRVPKNNIILFGVCDETEKFYDYSTLESWALKLDLEVVPKIFEGKITDPTDVFKMIDKISILGGQKIEGVVVKNYSKGVLFGNVALPITAGKYVSEQFKEVHATDWTKENTARGKFDVYATSYKSEARWHKAIQHLAEAGKLEKSPRDIGALMKEIQEDIKAENEQEIKNFLFKEFYPQICRVAISGFPEWYKRKLVEDMKEEQPKEKCDKCYGYGLWGVGDACPMGPCDASDGLPTIPCPKCGANANP